MKKTLFLCFVLITLIVINLYAGGGSQSRSQAGGTVTLQVWGGVPAEFGPQASIDLFNREFRDRGIQAEYTRFVNDTDGNIRLDTTLMSGDTIDVFINYYFDMLIRRIDANMALDLTDRINNDSSFDKNGFGGAIEAFTYNGRYYGIPSKLNNEGIMVNKDMFDAAGIPVPTSWTLREFREIARRLTTGDGPNRTYGLFQNFGPTILWPIESTVMATLGGDWLYSNDGRSSNLDSPVIRQIVQTFYDIIVVDRSTPSWADIRAQRLTMEGFYLSGRSAMAYGSWGIRSVKDTAQYGHDFVTAFVPYPVLEGQSVNFYPNEIWGDLMTINPRSRNIDAAWEYIKWYTQQGMLPMAEWGRIPIYSGFNPNETTSALLSGAERILDFDSTLRVKISPPTTRPAIPTITNRINELRQILIEEVEAILNGVKSVERGLGDAKSRSDALLR